MTDPTGKHEPTPEEVKAAHDWFEDLVYDVTRLIDPLDPNLEIVEPAIRKERDAVSENFMLVIRAAVEARQEWCAKEFEGVECSCGFIKEMKCGRCHALSAIRRGPEDNDAEG